MPLSCPFNSGYRWAKGQWAARPYVVQVTEREGIAASAPNLGRFRLRAKGRAGRFESIYDLQRLGPTRAYSFSCLNARIDSGTTDVVSGMHLLLAGILVALLLIAAVDALVAVTQPLVQSKRPLTPLDCRGQTTELAPRLVDPYPFSRGSGRPVCHNRVWMRPAHWRYGVHQAHNGGRLTDAPRRFRRSSRRRSLTSTRICGHFTSRPRR